MSAPKKKQWKLAKWELSGYPAVPVYVKQYPNDKLKRKAKRLVAEAIAKAQKEG